MVKTLATIDDLTPDAECPIEDRAIFRASFPPIQSAIKVYGDRQGMRVQLDVPESEMAEAMKVFLWRECVLTITVEPCYTQAEQDHGQKSDDLAARPKRKSKWQTQEGELAECAIGGGWQSDC